MFIKSYDIITETQKNNYDAVNELVKKVNLDYKDKNHKTALFYAIENKNVKMIDLLINNNANINIKDDRGLLPIHYAVLVNDEEVMKYFIEKGLISDIEKIKKEISGINLKDTRYFLSIIKKIL